MNILTIDWDYFALAGKRAIFPSDMGSRNSFNSMLKSWAMAYNIHPYLEEIGLKNIDFGILKEVLRGQTPKGYMVCHEHVDAYQFVLKSFLSGTEGGVITLVNIDFHHDMWPFDRMVTSANWLEALLLNNGSGPMKPENIIWVKDSNSMVDMPVLNFIQQTNKIGIIKGMQFDYIFLCKSDWHSPPHLDVYFLELTDIISKGGQNLKGTELDDRMQMLHFQELLEKFRIDKEDELL